MTELPDRLLRDALRAGTPPVRPDVCIDAEALAAWVDGTMSGAGRAAFDLHAADCARCQALAAAMVRMEPPPAQPAWRRAVFSWMMPLAAATAAIVIVVSFAVTERRTSQPQQSRTEPTAAPASPADDKALAVTGPQAAASPKPESRRERTDSSATPSAQSNSVAAPQSAASRTAAQPATGALQDAAAKIEARAKDVAPQASPRPLAAPASPAAAPAAPAPPPVASPTAETTRARAAGQAISVERPASLPLTALAAKGLIPTNEPTLIASPARDSLWRIAAGVVAHSTDGGVTWQEQALGAEATVRAGAAPAARVCWLAGARGLVLLTTDGEEWRRLAFPEAVDLVAIQATDAAHATVTAATGRRFSTADGGKSWTILPPAVDKH